jgi:hypothetical protein
MCNHFHNARTDVYFHRIKPNPCHITFSFGFIQRNNHGWAAPFIPPGQNPYGLVPMPSPNLYPGPFIPTWTFAVNLRIQCENNHGLCNHNIILARKIHTAWHNSPIWQTHPRYYNGRADKGVDFIASPKINKFYLVKGTISTPVIARMADWFVAGNARYGTGIVVEKVDVLPADGVDLIKWIIERINEINEIISDQDDLGNIGLIPIP